MNIVAVEPVGITWELAKKIEREFADLGHKFIYYPDRKEDEENLKLRMKDADIVIISNIPLKKAVLSECKRLKYIALAFTGMDHIDLDYCKDRGIKVQNASGYATRAVAELSIALMLDVYRKITELDAKTRNLTARGAFLGRELYGKTLGIVGTGAIGTYTARLAQAFGCKVLAYNRSEHEEIKEMGISYFPLVELVRNSDIISLHLPLTQNTYHLISKEMLALCKPSSILINTARGNVVDMYALADALKNGKLAGAGIDVYEKEPPLEKDHPLLSAPNVILLPHVGYASQEAFGIRIDIIMNNVRRYIMEGADA